MTIEIDTSPKALAEMRRLADTYRITPPHDVNVVLGLIDALEEAQKHVVELDARLLHFSDVCNNREEQIDTLRNALEEARADCHAEVNADLVAALEPFALNVEAISLSNALGHITREHLLAARAALCTALGIEKIRELNQKHAGDNR